ncbi:serine protease 7-like, partial [Drosophila takahashii]|uniref:serine protease 7-like n=1 Tax=Drosophila takahashii TaxID=29030 RepID=UPI00389910A3
CGTHSICCLGQKASGRIITSLPQPPTCGGFDSNEKILGGSETGLYEFPWLVLLEYRKQNEYELTFNCAGSLINHRYVLTAAHCLYREHLRGIGDLVSVRLGEYDTRTDEDCSDFGGKCAPKYQRFGVEEIRIHEGFRGMHGSREHDIGLIRLNQNVVYSDNIQPICLPSTDHFEGRYHGQPFIVAGWGRTSTSESSPTKQKVKVKYVDANKCRRKYEQKNIFLQSTQLCAGQYQKDSCKGDSGGPLMQFRGGVWVLEGIVSFGKGCGQWKWPGVYTDVAAYNTWIRENIVAKDGDYVDIMVDPLHSDNWNSQARDNEANRESSEEENNLYYRIKE